MLKVESPFVEGKKDTQTAPKDNGALVNSIGFFEETAAVWSAILLDEASLKVLLNKRDVQIDNLGVSQSSLFHWVAAVASLDQTDERLEKAKKDQDLKYMD